MSSETEQRIRIRAAVNTWISKNFPEQRRFISHTPPQYNDVDASWAVELVTRVLDGQSTRVGSLLVDDEARIVQQEDPESVSLRLIEILSSNQDPVTTFDRLVGRGFDFHLGDGILGAHSLPNGSVDLLLTDPPYGISSPYTSEKQVPRRLRKDGTDFIMPRGDFGEWDSLIDPGEWFEPMLPKVRGWAVTFCAQSQIGEYCDLLKEHQFVAVGTMVWHKTNPVPFNHKFKPVNAWEAIVVGKRPGTKFNGGGTVHNVLQYKSPSPQHRIHSTQKPLPLIEQLIRLFSDPGDTVLDPFAGSATTVLAGVPIGRNVIAYEKTPETFLAACKRLQEYLP